LALNHSLVRGPLDLLGIICSKSAFISEEIAKSAAAPKADLAFEDHCWLTRIFRVGRWLTFEDTGCASKSYLEPDTSYPILPSPAGAAQFSPAL